MPQSIERFLFGIFHLQSSQIAIASYFMEWHHSNRAVKRIIFMMIQRSQHAVVVGIPFFTVSLETYAKIISTAGSYIAVLNGMLQNWIDSQLWSTALEVPHTLRTWRIYGSTGWLKNCIWSTINVILVVVAFSPILNCISKRVYVICNCFEKKNTFL